ncbi:MAG TPA: MarR family transcriptional regulator [bacterium]|nr:MarR family transcriptional regulator [bacterium]
MTLSPVMQKYILHWGEMGTRWGVNRTVAQIHALLYLSPKPLNAEEIAGTLSIARSSVSTSLRELQSWGLIKVAHVLGDRRDHFESMTDVWEMFRVVLEERKRREIDPIRAMLRESVAELERGGGADAYTRQRLSAMLEFFETMSGCYEQMRRLPTRALIRFVKMGGKVRKLLGIPS